MVTTKKRILALVVALVMCISYLPLSSITASAADVSYTYDGDYIYNWGERGEVATFMSPNALEFYTGSRSYETLSSYSGGTTQSNASSSALYKNLQSVMKGAHRYTTSYNATKSLFKYTDCENGGGKISSFYSGKAIGPSWDGNWNREHTWPNSKGLGGSDEDDIMMLRPTSISENSSRGNTAYGQSGSYYNPNSESGGRYDLRGDVARIFLYVYVRWGNTGKAWGTGGVMESVSVLLQWMEQDPVDTWELGRNDSVESITGTRNVFVDYPELAFLLFGEEIPDGMSTPSGNADTKCNHNNFDTGVVIMATCTAGGYTLYTCKTAGCTYSYKANVTDAKGHRFEGGSCVECGAKEALTPSAPTYVSEVKEGAPYKLGLYSSEKSAQYYFTGSMSGYYGATDTDFANGVDVYVVSVSGGYYLYFKDSGGNKQYINLVIDGTYYNFKYGATASSVFTWDAGKCAFKTTLSGETCYIGTYGKYVTMGVLRESKMADTDYVARMYTEDSQEDTPDTPDTPDVCQHVYMAVVTPPTCTKGGFTTYTCKVCADSYKAGETSATGVHEYQDGVCTGCGAVMVVSDKVTISFKGANQRVSISTSSQVWASGGLTVTNNKAAASSNVADYTNPVRFYQGSDVIIEFNNIVKIEIDCTGLESKYVTSWLNAPAGATATNNGGIVTVTFNTAVDRVEYISLAKQSRAYSITVYAEAEEPLCEHKSTSTIGAVAPDCESDGHTGVTYCADCGEVIDEGEVVGALGHKFSEWVVIEPTCISDGGRLRECESCDYLEEEILEATGHGKELVKGATAPTCEADGHTGITYCADCGDILDEGEIIKALGHFDADLDEICDVCDNELSNDGDDDDGVLDDGDGDGEDDTDGTLMIDRATKVVLIAAVCIGAIVVIIIACT